MPSLSKYNFKGHPKINFLVLNIKDKLYYYPMEYMTTLDEKGLKKKQKNIGKLKKYIEKNDLDMTWKSDFIDVEKIISNKFDKQDLFKNRMNSIGIFEKNFT